MRSAAKATRNDFGDAFSAAEIWPDLPSTPEDDGSVWISADGAYVVFSTGPIGDLKLHEAFR